MSETRTLKELGGWVVEEECIFFYCKCDASTPRNLKAFCSLGPADEAEGADESECRLCGRKYKFVYHIEVSGP